LSESAFHKIGGAHSLTAPTPIVRVLCAKYKRGADEVQHRDVLDRMRCASLNSFAPPIGIELSRPAHA
jgi:hypothetical protein